MNTIIIDGKTINVDGNNVSIVNGTIIVGGKTIASDLTGIVKIKWEGELAELNCNNCEIDGNIHGDVKCNNADIAGDVGGSIKGNVISCGNVSGDVKGNVVNHR